MIKSTEYPMNIGGRGYQKEYKGFDIAVIIKKEKESGYSF